MRILYDTLRKNEHVPFPLAINQLRHHVFVSGYHASGYKEFLARLSNMLCDNYPEIGVLNIRTLREPIVEKSYRFDKVIKHGSPELQVPYFFKGLESDDNFYLTAKYLNGALGLETTTRKEIQEHLEVYGSNGDLPVSIKDFFDQLLKILSVKWREWLPCNEFGLLRDCSKAALNEQTDKEMSLTAELPDWFNSWTLGAKICIDLTNCSKWSKKLLTFGVLNLIRAVMPERRGKNLKCVVMIDNASEIIGKTPPYSYMDSTFYETSQLEFLYNVLLELFQKKGVGLVVGEELLGLLTDVAYRKPNIKILFNMSKDSTNHFTANPEERFILSNQSEDVAVVYNDNDCSRTQVDFSDI